MIDIIISQDMIPVLVTLFVVAFVTLATIAYVSKERFFFPVFLIIPSVLICVYISWATVSNLLGFPVAMAIPDRSIYIAHAVNEEKNLIYVWAKAPEDSKPRLYEIPKTDNNKKQMQESAKRSEKGIPQLIRGKTKNKKGHPGQTIGGDYQRYDFNVGHREFKYNGQYPTNNIPQNLPNMMQNFNAPPNISNERIP